MRASIKRDNLNGIFSDPSWIRRDPGPREHWPQFQDVERKDTAFEWTGYFLAYVTVTLGGLLVAVNVCRWLWHR